MDQQQLFLLLSRTAEGKQEAFYELYRLTCGQLFAVAMKMLKKEDLAEKAVQEAYLKIWHNAADYQRCKGSVLTWMIGVVRYRVQDLILAHDIRSVINVSEQQAYPRCQEPSCLTTTEGARLEQCLEELDDDQRQAIHAAYFNGVDYQEVADGFSTTPTVIKRRIRGGLQRMRRYLTL